MGKKRTFKVGEDVYDVEDSVVEEFIKKAPKAIEIKSFTVDNDTFDVELPQVEAFLKAAPQAKPLFTESIEVESTPPAPQEQTLPLGLDSILPPVVAGRDPLDPNENESFNPPPPSSPEPPPAPEPPRVEVTRQQRDAITRSALKVPKDIRDNPVFGTRYIKDVSARTGINEQAVKQIYEQGVNDENKYIELKSQYDITPNDSPDKNMQLHEMGQLLINLGRYDEAIEAYKGMEKRLFDQGIAEYKPGMPPNYVDQKQVPAFIGVMNAVYGKGDMKEYERLLKIAELKGIYLSGMPMVGGGDTVQPGNEMTYMGDQMVPVGTPDKGVKSRTSKSDYINSIADALSSLTGFPQMESMTIHGAEKFGKYFKDEFMNPKRGWNPWSQYMVGEQGKERNSFSNYLGMLTGAVETVLAPAMYSTPGGVATGTVLMQLPPEAQELIMPVSLLARKYYGEGKVPENIENIGVLADLLVAAGAHVGAKKVGKIRTMSELMREIEKIPEAEVRMLFEQADKRYKESGLPPESYAQEVLKKAKVVENEVRTIEESMPVEPYNPEPAPESLRTVPEGVDVEYNGVVGKLERGDDGTWYFVDGEGKSTQIPVEDKFNPTEKLTELGIQVMPEISKEAVARAVADREQVGEVEYRGKKYFVSLDNPMNESPTGDLVFERTADGRLLNRFDSHPDPVFAEQRKLAIVNKYLADKSLPARSKLIEPWKEVKPEQPRVELPKIEVRKPVVEPTAEPVTKTETPVEPSTEPSTPVSAEIAPEDAVTPEGVKMVETITAEEIAPKEKEVVVEEVTPAEEPSPIEEVVSAEKENPLLEDALKEYEEATPEKKQEMVEQVETQLERAKKADDIGFPLDPEMVETGEKFLEKVKKDVEKAKEKVAESPEDVEAQTKLEEAKQRLKDIQGKRKAEALKKIDDFEQWALNLPGIKDMSGGAKKAGIGAAEVVKGITDIVRKSVEAGFDIADAVADAIEKYKRLAPEIIEAITEDAILTRFGVEKEMFAAKNKATAKLREKLGIPQDVEVTAQNKRDFSQVMENAKKLRDEGAKPKDIADRIVRDGYMVSAEEQHLLVENEIALYNERREIEKKLEKIDPNKIERGEEHYKLFERLDEIQAEQGLMFAALERAGREQSLVFRMRQLAMNREYSVQAFVSNYKARTGHEPTPQQIKEAERLEREIRDTEARRAELEYKAKEEEMQGIIEDLREELERERVRKKGGLTKEKQARKVELKRKYAGRFNDISSVAKLFLEKDFMELMSIYVEEAANDFTAFTRKLVEELGPKIEPHAKEIFDRVNKRQYNPPYMENGRLRFDTNMLKSIVEAGVKDHKDFLAKVHEIAKEELPDITEREVADAISGYGKTINPTLDAVTKQLNSLKRDLKLASGLEDVRAGKGVLRSGYRPPEYTDEQRQVMREIREELKNYPEDEASTQKKWTTALGKIKKTLENSIRDTEARIKALEQGLPVESKERKRVQLDERAQQLKEQLEDLKKRAKELEGPKTVSDEQLVRNAIAAMERSEREYNRRTQEIRQTGKYTPTNRRVVSDPELDIARQARDRAKEEFDYALSTTDYPAQAATQKALAAAEDRLSELENKIARNDLSYRQKAINLVDQSNPMLVAAKEKIKTQQATLKAMREASGEAERHMQELWTTRKENSIKELKRKLDEKDYTKKVRKETPLTEEMIRLKAKEDRLKFDFEVAIERARLEGRGTKEKVIDAIIEAGSLPKALNASLDLSAVGRQGSILTALHPLMGARGFVEMLRQFKSKERADQWHNNLVNSEKYIVAKRSGVFINEPMAKLAAKEEQFMSRLADKIPGVAGSNRAYSAYLNFMRIEAFTSFRDMLIEKGYKGEALQKELNGYATFINDATGRGSLKFGKMNLELAAPILNAFMFSPRFASSRFRIYIRHILGGFMTPPRARIRAYRALAQYGASVYLTQQILKGAGMEVSDDILSSDFGKARNGDISYDMMSGLQQPFVLMARLYNGAYVDRRGERKKLNEGNNLTYNQLISNYLASKASPTLSMALAAGSGKFYDGEDFEVSKLPERMLVPLILQDLRRMYGEENLNVDQVNWSPAGAERAAKNLPALMLGIGVNYQPEEPDVKNAQFSPKVKELIKKHKYKPEGTNDRSYYLDNEVKEITDEEMEKIEILRAKYAGEMINQMADIDMFDGLTQKAFDRKMNQYYNQALKKAKNEVLPAGWKDRKKITDED